MPPDVILLGKSEVDWNPFLKAMRDLNQRVTDTIDQANITPGGVASFILTLAEFKAGVRQNVQSVLSNPGQILQHCYYQFLVVSDDDTLMSLLCESNVDIIYRLYSKNNYVYVASANLETWRSVIINHCSEVSSFELRALFTKILLIFDKEGLSKVFSDFQRKTLSDRTICLDQK